MVLAAVPCSASGRGPVTLDFSPLGTARAKGAVAPMDRSFGTYPMSVFGIAHAIHRYDGTKHLDAGPIAYAIVAIRDWERRFPSDPWVARELFAMQCVYEHAHTSEGARYERAVALWIENDYPWSRFAKASRADLARERKPR